MPRIYKIGKTASAKLRELIKLDSEYQTSGFKSKQALGYSIEYIFLEGFKTWENFVEDLFTSHARYNDPVSGKRSYPYLAPKTESHALELLTLEKDYLDWTSPDNILVRAKTCFKKDTVITTPIKRNLSALRDMRKIRNHVAHGSKESLRLFKDLSRRRLGIIVARPGDYLNKQSPRQNKYIQYFII